VTNEEGVAAGQRAARLRVNRESRRRRRRGACGLNDQAVGAGRRIPGAGSARDSTPLRFAIGAVPARTSTGRRAAPMDRSTDARGVPHTGHARCLKALSEKSIGIATIATVHACQAPIRHESGRGNTILALLDARQWR